MDRAQPRLLYPSIALAIVVFSLSAILVRFADEAPGLAIAVWRTWIAVLLLTPFMLRQRQRQPFAFSRKDKWFILVAGVLLGLHFVTWIESIHHTSIASATVILSTTPVFVAIGGFLFLKERFKLSTSVGILLALVGSVVIAWSDFTTAANTPLLWEQFGAHGSVNYGRLHVGWPGCPQGHLVAVLCISTLCSRCVHNLGLCPLAPHTALRIFAFGLWPLRTHGNRAADHRTWVVQFCTSLRIAHHSRTA